MTVSTNEVESKPTYIGLWTKEDKNGNHFWSGSHEEKVYFVFGTKDPYVKTLSTVPSGSDRTSEFTKVGTFSKTSGKNGDFYKFENMCIFKNEKRIKETHPHFNLVIYND